MPARRAPCVSHRTVLLRWRLTRGANPLDAANPGRSRASASRVCGWSMAGGRVMPIDPQETDPAGDRQ